MAGIGYSPANYLGLRLPERNTGMGDIFGNILQGYQMSQVPGQLNRQKLYEEMRNKISTAEAEHAPKYFEERAKHGGIQNLMDALKYKLESQYGGPQKQAELEYAQQQAQFGPTGNVAILNALRTREALAREEGEDSPNVQKLDSYIDKITGTAATGTTKSRMQSAALANIGRQYLSEKEQPYKGTGSTLQFGNDRLEYETTKDPKKKQQLKEKLATAAAAWKIAPEYAGYQLSAQGITPTVHALTLQEKAIKQGWPYKMNTLIDNLPEDVQELANKYHSNWLKDVTRLREKGIEKGFKPLEENEYEEQERLRDSATRAFGRKPISKMTEEELINSYR